MKCTIVIDQKRDEEIIIYTHERSKLTDRIEAIAREDENGLFGYLDKSIVPLTAGEIFCFTVEDGKVFALTESQKLRVQKRLYEIEESFGADFIKINQSCLVCAKKIAKFDVTLGGALRVTMKNGYRDYVSRRQLKYVKERMGF